MYSERVLQEMCKFMLGQKLGQGMSREVFVLPFDETKVVKVEDSSGCFQNVHEWEFWQNWQHDKLVKKWLAPCYFISDSGTFLIMDRTEPLPRSRTPKKVPGFLTDHKIANFGLLKNRVVCHDYGKVRCTIDDDLRNWWGE